MIQLDDTRHARELNDLRKREEEDLALLLSEKYGLPYLDASGVPIENDAVALLKEDVARKALAGVFSLGNKQEKAINVALAAPQSDAAQEVIKDLEARGFRPTLYLASKTGLERIWERYRDISLVSRTDAGVLDISAEELLRISKDITTTDDIKKLLGETVAQKAIHHVSKVLEVVLAGAISVGASDVHLEPEDELISIRYRLDGVLHHVAEIDKKIYKLVLSRLKLLSGLKLNVTLDTQDGRFSIKLGDDDIEIRTSILPSAYGEGVVMRILNPKSIELSLEDLGIDPDLLVILNREITKPNGMILTTGPTGSGKTTTLYAFLRTIYSSEIKVITIEDPIEYHLPGISQTQVNEGSNYTFLSGLRAALRQDPDVIMVGEIRDNDTAAIAINASLTGHLVLSTLHTNNAAGTIPRLVDLGVNPKVIGSALSVAIAQRLLRKLCAACKKEVPPTEDELVLLKRVLQSVHAKKGSSPDIQKLYVADKCAACNYTGYKGRVGVYEAILMDQEIEELIATNPSERQIREASVKQNILDMREDGVVKVISGVTSLDELSRTVDLD
ncbi:MAG: GspE/PulE family protein [Minisyncoccota bacterium]